MGTHLTERVNMDTLKTKPQYQYKSYLITFQYIVCPPALAITAMYIVPHDIMYLWRNSCRMAHLMSDTWDLPDIKLQWLCMLFNMSHTCLLGFKSTLCAGHLSVRRLFVTSITCVLLSTWRGVLSFANIISRLNRIWGKISGRIILSY